MSENEETKEVKNETEQKDQPEEKEEKKAKFSPFVNDNDTFDVSVKYYRDEKIAFYF